jgi:predicted transcriptional regulator
MPQSEDPLLPLVARIVSAQVEHHDTPGRILPSLIRDVYRALATVEPGRSKPGVVTPVASRQAPAGETVFDDHLICLECGLHMKMLKRHLQTVHHETPAQYRAKWRLAGDYPMVARQYATLRSNLAKESGLGKRPAARAR